MKKIVLLTILFAAFLVPQCVKAVDLEGFYVGATGAANFIQNSGSNHHHRGNRNRFDTGFFGAIDLGYRWCSGFHLQAEVAYLYNDHKKNRRHSGDVLGSGRRHRGHRDVWAAMVNVLYDINLCWCVEPYVGVGIGYAHVRNERHDRFFERRHDRKNDNQFAWQVIAGLAYPICDNIDVAVEYRFFDTTTSRHEKNLYNHAIGANLKYYF